MRMAYTVHVQKLTQCDIQSLSIYGSGSKVIPFLHLLWPFNQPNNAIHRWLKRTFSVKISRCSHQFYVQFFRSMSMVCPWNYEIIIRIDFFLCWPWILLDFDKKNGFSRSPASQCQPVQCTKCDICMYICVLAGSEPNKNRSLSSLFVRFRHAYHKIWIFSRFVPISFSFSFTSRSYLCPVFEPLFLFVCSAFFFSSFHFILMRSTTTGTV